MQSSEELVEKIKSNIGKVGIVIAVVVLGIASIPRIKKCAELNESAYHIFVCYQGTWKRRYNFQPRKVKSMKENIESLKKSAEELKRLQEQQATE